MHPLPGTKSWATWRTGVASERGLPTCDNLGTEHRFQKSARVVRGSENLFFYEKRKAFTSEIVAFGALGGGEICGFSLGMGAVEPISTCWPLAGRKAAVRAS